ncbi:L-aspartate oxidase [Bacillus marasmi]|uniref:L-aspartate oxidase n=1 Tax=Bacillus marasmi TaxID=1926279 RepID=UPI0011C8D313|nr:L-aspartate oxidase [Bacillus marasmi]
MNKADVIVIGSGIAALQLAHHISADKNVRILTKSSVKASNSSLAQGGIAASIGADDHVTLHSKDTMEAGRFHNNEEVVIKITEEAPLLIQELHEAGCPFDQDSSGKLKLGMEGAHSHYRIVHSGGDATGKNVIDFLVDTLPKNTSIIENMFAYELLINDMNQCIGVKVKDEAGNIHCYYADHTVIATGGCSYVYSLSAGSPNVTGDGIAMAYLAGAEITDMEFIQFHPTMLIKNGEVKGLISEAVRGQGAKLVTNRGELIMEGVHPLKDLAPRHVVSQTIYDYIHNGEEIFLDISSIDNFEAKFPTITDICLTSGINPKDGLIPVAPGSHFLMGGIKVDLHGQTNIHGLYAIGEAACTGLHGANRLASNSLLEGLSFGKRLAEYINATLPVPNNEKTVLEIGAKNSSPVVVPDFKQLRERMMEYVGIVRTEQTLAQQKAWLEGYFRLDQVFPSFDKCTTAEIQSILASVIALLITDAALKRTESRGGHFRADYPMENKYWQNNHIVYQYSKGRLEANEQNQTTDHVRAVFC